jgi:ribosome maturation factor RimP
MNKQELISSLRQTIEDCLKHQGLELVDFICHYEGRDLYLRILVDRPEVGISLEECAYLNTRISRILDGKDILQQRYILEVSSPGLDRPLVTRSDFLRCQNKQVKFFFKEKINGKMELEGTIKQAGEKSVEVQIGSQIVPIPLAQIAKAKQSLIISNGD